MWISTRVIVIFTERVKNKVYRWCESEQELRTGGGMKRDREKEEWEMREGGATTVGDMPQIINQCQMLQIQIKRGPERERERREIQRGRAWQPSCKDDWREKCVCGGARGEVNQEGECMYMSSSYVLSLSHSQCSRATPWSLRVGPLKLDFYVYGNDFSHLHPTQKQRNCWFC